MYRFCYFTISIYELLDYKIRKNGLECSNIILLHSSPLNYKMMIGQSQVEYVLVL